MGLLLATIPRIHGCNVWLQRQSERHCSIHVYTTSTSERAHYHVRNNITSFHSYTNEGKLIKLRNITDIKKNLQMLWGSWNCTLSVVPSPSVWSSSLANTVVFGIRIPVTQSGTVWFGRTIKKHWNNNWRWMPGCRTKHSNSSTPKRKP
jgi:hypothetical protein